ncbi:hypothetical protein BGZ91_006695 [Linnemannia elongata]|nr:hypothetical protein BGZ91_006695 [Linnemannia elongata]
MSYDFTAWVPVEEEGGCTGVVEMGMGDTQVFESVLWMGEDALDGGEDLSSVWGRASVDHDPFMGLVVCGRDRIAADEEGGDGEADGSESEDECAAIEAWAQFKELILVWKKLDLFCG